MGAIASSASVAPGAAAGAQRRGATAPTFASISARMLPSGVSRVMRWLLEGSLLESSVIADMIGMFASFDDSAPMTEKTLNLRGLKCPLPALRARKALGALQSGDILIVECTDPLTAIDIPNLLNQTGDTLEDTAKEKKLLTFRIRKK